MGQEAVYGSAPAFYDGGVVAAHQEASSRYAELGHEALIELFYETEGDARIGRELSARLFAHAGLEGDLATKPLIGRDGEEVQGSEGPLMLADYVNFAAEHHFDALEEILSFLTMKPGQPDYEAVRAAMLSRLDAGKQ